MITKVFIISLLASFVLLLAKKVGAIEWLQVHGNDIVHELASCSFCLSWWVCVVLSLVLFVATLDRSVLAVPFLATPITRYLS